MKNKWRKLAWKTGTTGLKGHWNCFVFFVFFFFGLAATVTGLASMLSFGYQLDVYWILVLWWLYLAWMFLWGLAWILCSWLWEFLTFSDIVIFCKLRVILVIFLPFNYFIWYTIQKQNTKINTGIAMLIQKISFISFVKIAWKTQVCSFSNFNLTFLYTNNSTYVILELTAFLQNI